MTKNHSQIKVSLELRCGESIGTGLKRKGKEGRYDIWETEVGVISSEPSSSNWS